MEEKQESRPDCLDKEDQVNIEEQQKCVEARFPGYEKIEDTKARYAFLSSVFRKAISKSFSDLGNSIDSEDEFFTHDLVSLVKIAKGKGIPVSISEVMQNEIVKIQNEDTNQIEIETTIECQRKISNSSNSDDLMVDEFEELRKSRYFIQRCIKTIKEIEAGLIWRALPENEDVGVKVVNKHIKTKVFIDAFVKDHLNPFIVKFTEIPPKTTEEARANASLHFTGLYRAAHRALHACKKHLPTAFGQACYQKLNILLEYVFQICNINMNYINIDFNVNNEVNVNDLKVCSAKMIHTIYQNYLAPPIEKKKPKPQPKKIRRRPIQLKKPDVPSRYMTATFKHRPPVEKHQKTEKKESAKPADNNPKDSKDQDAQKNPSQTSSAISFISKDGSNSETKDTAVKRKESRIRPKSKKMLKYGEINKKPSENSMKKLGPLSPTLEKQLLEQKIALKKLQKRRFCCLKNFVKPMDSINETPDETDDSEFVFEDSLSSLD